MNMKDIFRSYPLLISVFVTSCLVLPAGCKKETIRYGTVSDIEGNIYKTVEIGSLWWMAENLKTTKYNDGIEIPVITDNDQWKALTTGAYSWYDNNEQYEKVYGMLYNWHAVNTGKLCPAGWHIPGYDDWTYLIDHLGGMNSASAKLRETGTKHWTYPNTGASNSSGFTALPGGYRHPLGDFLEIGNMGYWWFATETNPGTAWCLTLIYNNSLYMDPHYEKIWGFSVRCVQD